MQKKHKCDVCGYVAAYKSVLTRHMHKHTGEKPFKCTHEGCDYASTTCGNLTTHMRTHLKPKKLKARTFKCTHEGCGYTTTKKNQLVTHANKRNHTGENIYKCKFCAFYAGSYVRLSIHLCKEHLLDTPK